MNNTDASTKQPEIVKLDESNAISLLGHYVERAQQVGSLDLNEASIVKNSLDVCLRKTQPINKNFTFEKCIDNLIKAVSKGQAKGGAYSLNDAHNIVQIITFIQQNIQSLQNGEIEEVKVQSSSNTSGNFDNDLSELSEPVPLTNVIDV